MVISKDLQNKRLTVVREFEAPLELVWNAWTKSEQLDKWWAPKPFRAETKSMDFREGGFWLYCMVGPEGIAAWCRVDYQSIEPMKRIVDTDVFCDEQGVRNLAFPAMDWNKEFSEADGVTTVHVVLSFEKEADMEMIIQMGFQEGFTAGLQNLEELLQATVPA